MKTTFNKNQLTKRNLFLTMTLVLATTFAFAQEATTKHAINSKGTAAANGKVIETEVITTPTESIEVVRTRCKTNQTNERVVSTEGNIVTTPVTDLNAVKPLTSEKKHTKSGHVTLLK
jgi:hypothetical protein